MILRSLLVFVAGCCLIPPGVYGASTSSAPSFDKTRIAWNAPQKPFRIYGNTWYVGPHGLSAILVDTGKGLALFDGDLPESAPQIEAHLRELGFHVHDIKWIFNSHAHADHAGGIAALQRASGAQVLASAEGARELEAGGAYPPDPQYGFGLTYTPVKRVRVVRDGETLHLGDVVVTAHYTPGHTPGSTSWTWTSCEAGRCLHIAYVDSLTALAAPGYRFNDHPPYVAAFRRSIASVSALPCDILLTPHPGASDFWERVARRKSPDDVAPLVDDGACRAYAVAAGKGLDAQLVRERTTAK
ncbi:MAG TPA: subclass B3 metallo-beta-lactamase [Rhodanobacteraceae bacterium]|nr:subclass B3 metallo-beta-lactamase [Rhodanobacteraceae bacterium]